MSFCPEFWTRLSDPAIQTVLLCGCGGGFDFVHGMLLVPGLRSLGKQVVMGSYSFGDPKKISGSARVVFEAQGDLGPIVAKRVDAQSTPPAHYGPEIHVCSFLDQRYPATAPHGMYAYYARDYCVPNLRALLEQLVAAHEIDAVVLVDGGSDSLMRGDEEGLGDPIEDAVSVAAVAGLTGLRARILLSVGLGADRFNHVSDAATLRAIAELTSAGGFLGAASLLPESEAFQLYRQCVEHIYSRQSFRSVLTGAIMAAAEGYFGDQQVPPYLQQRLRPGQAFFWPLMAMLWGFDIEAVAQRSLLVSWIRGQSSVVDCYRALDEGRQSLELRDVEELPSHRSYRNPNGRFY